MITPSYEVHLDMFEGPLDLLLYLIRKSDLNVYDIPISEITQEYLSYLDMMKDLNLEMAGEFLVMASTLMQIKARMLLPSHEGEEAEGADPREELVAKLLEYQKFKEASKFLEKRSEEFKDVFYRGAPHFTDEEKTLSLNMFDLLSTLQEILDQAEDRGIVIQGEQFPVEEKMNKIQAMLEVKSWVSFRDIFRGETRKLAILSCFMALLELIKLQKVFARQDAAFGEILIYKKEAPPPAPIWPGAEQAPAGPDDRVPPPEELPLAEPPASGPAPEIPESATESPIVSTEVPTLPQDVFVRPPDPLSSIASEETVGALETEADAERAKPFIGTVEAEAAANAEAAETAADAPAVSGELSVAPEMPSEAGTQESPASEISSTQSDETPAGDAEPESDSGDEPSRGN